jgi:hypothetical protein
VRENIKDGIIKVVLGNQKTMMQIFLQRILQKKFSKDMLTRLLKKLELQIIKSNEDEYVL